MKPKVESSEWFSRQPFTAPAWGATATALPGTLNYIEGQASVSHQKLNPKSIGSVE